MDCGIITETIFPIQVESMEEKQDQQKIEIE